MQTGFFSEVPLFTCDIDMQLNFFSGGVVAWGDTSCLPLHVCSLSSSGSSVPQEAGLHGLHHQILLPSG